MPLMSQTFADAYSRRAEGFRPSPVRSVFDVSMRPGMISLAGGNPDLTVLPAAQIGEMARRLIATQGTDVLQYGASAGTEELRSLVGDLVREQGIECTEEDILITSGSQMGLELITSLFCDPGDVVLTEAPTYVGALSVFRGQEARTAHVACDENGLVPEALESAILHQRAAGRTVKLLYTVPNFNNPSGTLLSAPRRARIAEICARLGVLVVEDDPYGLLSFAEPVPPAIRAFDPNVLYLGSLSKIFSPGIRVGWIVAPREVRDRLQLAGEATTICASVLSQHLAVAYLSSPGWRDTLHEAVKRYRDRRDALMDALEEHGPEGIRWDRPEGGFFAWVRLPQGVSAERLLQASLDHGAAFVPGTAFFADGSGDDHARFSFSFEPPERIRHGVERIMSTMAEMRRSTGIAPPPEPAGDPAALVGAAFSAARG